MEYNTTGGGALSGTTSPSATSLNGNGSTANLAKNNCYPTGTINKYGQITDDNPGPNDSSITIAAGDIGQFAVGDEVLIIQMRHATNAGKYEFKTIPAGGISGQIITFSAPLANAYYGSAGKAQIVKAPNYTDFKLALGTSIIPSAYASATGKGGIVIFRANGSVTVNGTISTSGYGFAGGAACSSDYCYAYQGDSYSAAGGQSTGPNAGGGGAGMAGTSNDLAGGGGAAHSSSGANGTVSGAGMAAGSGSTTVYGEADLSALYLGSGGGGGAADLGYPAGRGGYGGGIVFITANSLTVNSAGSIQANAEGGLSEGYVGGGGGGSGGSVYLGANTASIGTNLVAAAAGAGGNTNYADGGAGSAGRVYVKGASTGASNPAATTAGAYYASGAYISLPKAVGSGTKFGTISWTETLNGQTNAVKARSCDDAACTSAGTVDESTASAKQWANINNITSGSQLTSSTGITQGDGWIQYETTLSTANTAVTPTLDSVTITTIPLVLEMRAGNTATPDASWTDGGNWTNAEIGSGATPVSPVSLGATFDGNQYIQYRANLSTTDTAYTPSLDDITFNYQYYPANTDYILTSSAFNSGDSVNIVNQIQWNESVPTGTDVKFQVRTAPDNGSGSPDWTSVNASKWCGPTSCASTTGDTDYANSYYNTTPAGETLNTVH
ncbi:MAG: hypothetical protein AAB425_11750, partial [Bdellovibrionota bacterium]